MQELTTTTELEAISHQDISNPSEELSHLPNLLQRIYHSRGITCAQQLNKDLTHLLPFTQLLNINAAAERLALAMKKQERIVIIGDFDADGATSTALAISALRAFGAVNVDFLIPNRFTYGYGLTPEIVEVAHASQSQVLITVDNGIASHAGVTRANQLGIDVIITDHHLPADSLPDAYTIVNPNQSGDFFSSKCMAGVGVIFYVMLALRTYLEKNQWFQEKQLPRPNMAQFLDLVALGTVADMVPLDQNNRILVHHGVTRMCARQTRPGILALIEVAKRDSANLQVSDLGFAIAPRLNAAGRLDDMTLGVACLLAQDSSSAMKIAQQLEQLNEERRLMEAQMQREAFEIVKHLHLSNNLPMGLCLFDETWHQGIIGLVAGRVKEKLNRPVIAFAKINDTTLKGSARSVVGIHIRDVLATIATQHPELISHFGGHALAAGLSLDIAAYQPFSTLFAQIVAQQIEQQALIEQILIDGSLKSDEITLTTAELLNQGGPWGQGFPEPLFEGVFQLVDQRIVGQNHLKMVVSLTDGPYQFDAIAFNVDIEKWPNYHCNTVNLRYRLEVNEYRGRRKVQLMVVGLQCY